MLGSERVTRAGAVKHANAIFVPLQDMLNKHISEEPGTYWMADGNHPSIAGSAAIANQWLQIVGL
jgi:lysophospholipase L1-like esterase